MHTSLNAGGEAVSASSFLFPEASVGWVWRSGCSPVEEEEP